MMVQSLPRKARDATVGFTWGVRATRVARRQLRDGGVSAVLPPPPETAVTSLRGVRTAVRVCRATCLERSLVVQRWHLGQGREVDVLIGVARDGSSTLAHAWLDGEEWRNDRDYVEMTRVPAR